MADTLFNYSEISQMVVSETIQQAWAEMEASGLKDNLDGIKVEAQHFLNKVEQLHEKIQNVSMMQKKIYSIYQTTNANKIADAEGLAALRRMKDAFSQLGDLSEYNNNCLLFQNKLNWYYGQIMVVLYTGDDWSVKQHLNVGSHLSKGLASKGRGVIQRYKNRLLKKGEELTPADKKALERIKDLQAVAEEVRWRCEHSADKLNLHYLLLWIPGGQWKLAWIGNMGDIKEAYTSLALQSEIRFSGNIEQKIDQFVNSGLEKIDNASGILKGDFSIDKIQFAMKSLSASALSYEPLINTARSIVALGDNLTTEFMQNIYDDFTKDGIQRQVQKNVTKHLEKKDLDIQTAINAIVDHEWIVHLLSRG